MITYTLLKETTRKQSQLLQQIVTVHICGLSNSCCTIANNYSLSYASAVQNNHKSVLLEQDTLGLQMRVH